MRNFSSRVAKSFTSQATVQIFRDVCLGSLEHPSQRKVSALANLAKQGTTPEWCMVARMHCVRGAEHSSIRKDARHPHRLEIYQLSATTVELKAKSGK